MPLITFTGFPCSGKSTWATKLIEALEQKIEHAKVDNGPGHNYNIKYHTDDSLGIARKSYRESVSERQARGNQISAVRRDLSRSTFVILDSLAYIKGFRYQLFCEAKGVSTPHCVVHVINSKETVKNWNSSVTNESHIWEEDLIDQLCMRYEEPIDSNRWDSPLFTIAASEEDEQLPIDEIWDTLVLKRPPPPNNATLVKPTSGNNFMQELEKQTSEVIGKILQHQQLSTIGGKVIIDRDNGVVIEMPATTVSIAQLQRIRRTYIGLNRMRSVASDRITPMFSDYVNRNLNSDD
ncbi:kti12, chromatin associated [Yamadazyma tenuis]|uniref:Chromatin associated protein KTI12 n=1 Tax=Candida tenuis (strain ATCC 10573 / BCRC 21748 / CBS 615 / JCM 9827 / NBRC 10315 / NRRL Y-1498 / VKM Y-70) TaxID=590646 RepID=G3B8J1_CANTC|nr:chromatin associated protein KTI12 [Yamadazyma tenuis ATCC 10573]EGV61745.1 chromatin associated protein KTI12 [Yamadazyma tenuis ATCC 10573]WEJ92973.1 kti12, chromatin associated [Yamadazyma tenuis]